MEDNDTQQAAAGNGQKRLVQVRAFAPYKWAVLLAGAGIGTYLATHFVDSLPPNTDVAGMVLGVVSLFLGWATSARREVKSILEHDKQELKEEVHKSRPTLMRDVRRMASDVHAVTLAVVGMGECVRRLEADMLKKDEASDQQHVDTRERLAKLEANYAAMHEQSSARAQAIARLEEYQKETVTAHAKLNGQLGDIVVELKRLSAKLDEKGTLPKE